MALTHGEGFKMQCYKMRGWLLIFTLLTGLGGANSVAMATANSANSTANGDGTSALFSPECAKNQPCWSWVLRYSKDSPNTVCLGSNLYNKAAKKAKILPTEDEYEIRLVLDATKKVSKRVTMPKCNKTDENGRTDTREIFEVIYEFDQNVLSKNQVAQLGEIEPGVLSNLSMIGNYPNDRKIKACDPKLARDLFLDFAGGRLDRETSVKYHYQVTGNRLDLVFENQDICDTESGLVQMTFMRE